MVPARQPASDEGLADPTRRHRGFHRYQPGADGTLDSLAFFRPIVDSYAETAGRLTSEDLARNSEAHAVASHRVGSS
jgi:hypothetical protein